MELDLTKAAFTKRAIGHGVIIYSLFIEDYHAPLGMVWGTGHGTQNGESKFEVLGSYVPTWARRNGVRTTLNGQLLEDYDLITTNSGSPEGGSAFMKKSGYRFDRGSQTWWLRKPKGRKGR